MSAVTNQEVLDASVSVGTSAVKALSEQPQRQFLLIQNVHATQNIGFTLNGSTPVIAAAGTFTLTPSQAVLFDTFVPVGPVNVIGSGSSTTCTINYY